MDTKSRLQQNLDYLQSIHRLRSLKLKPGLVDFFSNDYLGLNRNQELLGQIKNMKQCKFGSGGSRLLGGNSLEAGALETRLASIHNQESALLFNSGYAANLAFFSTIPSKDSVIIYDQKIHACIKDGMRLSFAQKISFLHNNVLNLEKRLQQYANKECFVAIESIYSMDGDEAKLAEIADLCQKYGANLVVDEAHSTGNIGQNGKGLVAHLGLDSLVFAKIHTFGKAIGAHGAILVGSEVLKQYLINHARPFIFTTALPAHDVQVIDLIYTFIQENSKALQSQLADRIQWFREAISVPIPYSNSPIQVVIVPGNELVVSLSGFLESHGLDVRPVLSPTVAIGEERLRICLHNYNTKQEIEQLAQLINSKI